VVAQREWKVGGRALDLYVQLVMRDGGARHLFCEFKVDGTLGYINQARQLREDSRSKLPGEDHAYVWFALGGARFWDSPPDWHQVGPTEFLELLARLDVSGDTAHSLVRQYREALELEILRGEVAHPSLENQDEDLGFRGRDLWYAAYDRLRRYLAEPEEWSIYSGVRNPVLAHYAAWKDPRLKLPVGKLGYELNWNRFVAKTVWNKGAQSATALRQLLDTLWAEWRSSDLATRYSNARKGQRRKAEEVSTLLSVKLDLDDLAQAARHVNELSQPVRRMLAETAAAYRRSAST